MIVKLSLKSLKTSKWSDYAIRFVLGGMATVATGMIGSAAGPEVGGLFLALPAIFCASATLIERKERERKASKGLIGVQRGRDAAALEAVGASIGSVGMGAFALSAWLMLEKCPFAALVVATFIWGSLSVGFWFL